MKTEPLGRDKLREAVAATLNKNLFEVIDCEDNFLKRLEKRDGKFWCFLSHLDYKATIEAIAVAIKPFALDPKQFWYRVPYASNAWYSNYIYREDKALTISFDIDDLWSHDKKEDPPEWKEFSTYIRFNVYEEEP